VYHRDTAVRDAVGDRLDGCLRVAGHGSTVFCSQIHPLRDASPGEFSARSWNYWHLILGLSPLQAVPPLSVRRFA
jgi:hypothetical protein